MEQTGILPATKNVVHAVKNYMRHLSWDRFPSLVALPTAGDGSCALHAIVQSFHTPYQLGRYPDGNSVNRYEIVRSLRDELANKLNKPIYDDSDVDVPEEERKLTWYDKLSRGQLESYALNTKNLPDFPDLSRQGFERHLRSSAWLGQEVVEFISAVLGIGLITIFSDGHGHYDLNVVGRDADLVLDGHKKVVIILCEQNRHFSTVGRKESNNSIRVFFDASDDMIKEMGREFAQSSI